jgi:hypothetical protein
MTADWTTLSVTAMRGYVNLYRDASARDGCIVRPAPAVLLQQRADGARRSVWAVAVGAELVPADRIDGHVSVIRTSAWQTYCCLNRVDLLLTRETGGAA